MYLKDYTGLTDGVWGVKVDANVLQIRSNNGWFTVCRGHGSSELRCQSGQRAL